MTVPVYEPGSIDFSVDGGTVYDVNKWLSYGPLSAEAKAASAYTACNPSCAQDAHRRYVTFTLTLTAQGPCRGVYAYTRRTVTQSSNRNLLPDTSRSLRDFCS